MSTYELTKTETKILQSLLGNEGYLSSYELSIAAGISRRMVRTIVPQIRMIISGCGGDLISRANKGYKISFSDSAGRRKLTDLIESADKSITQLPQQSMDRDNYVMQRLITAGTYLKIDDLADELMLSRSAVNSIIRNVRAILKKRGLQLEQKPGGGLKISGSEISQRRILSDIIFRAFSQASMFYDFIDAVIHDSYSWEFHVLRIFRKYGIVFTDISLYDFLLTLAIQLERIGSGHLIEDMPDIRYLENEPEMSAAKEIAQLVSTQNVCEMNDAETALLAVSIGCRRSAGNMTLKDPDVVPLMHEILSEIQKTTAVDYTPYADNSFDLCLQLVLRQLRYHEKIRTEMWDSAFLHYPLAYRHACIVSSVLEKNYNSSLSVSQHVYLTEVFHAMQSKMRRRPLRTLLICGQTDSGDQEILRRITNRFPEELSITHLCRYYNLFEEKPEAYDLVISTIRIHRPVSVPYVSVSPFLTADDLNEIDSFIHEHFQLLSPATLFHPDLFRHHVSVNDQEDLSAVIDACLADVYHEHAFQTGKLPEKDLIYSGHKNVMLMETIRDMRCSCPWVIIVPDKPFVYNGHSSDLIFFFSGDRNSSEYKEIRSLILYDSILHDRKKDFLADPSYSRFISMITIQQPL